MVVSIGQAAVLVGVAISTLRRWEAEERFIPTLRTKGGHRRYSLSEIESEFLGKTPKNEARKTILYARVSSHDQKEDLKRQIDTLEDYSKEKNFVSETISDLGSGLNFKKKGLNSLITQVCSGSVERLILTHKDRLLRFGSPLLFKICSYFNTEVVILGEEKEKSFEETLAADVVEIITVFTSKVYGKRSHSNRRKKAA
jgi:predicted site-specific integrase-resolvase